MNQYVIEVGANDFAAEVERSALPVCVDFWAPWCGPCKALAPLFDEMARVYAGRIKFVKVNADDNRELGKRLDVRSLPTLLLLKHGKEIERAIGQQSKSRLVALFDRYAGALAATRSVPPAKKWRAFQGDDALRHDTVERVRKHVAADEIRAIGSMPPVADTDQGRYSLIGAASHSDDLERYETTFGIPSHVALLEEFVHVFVAEEVQTASGERYRSLRGATGDYPVRWLEAIPVGADLHSVTPRFLHWLLLDLIDAPLPFGVVVADGIKPAIRQLAALHARDAAGDRPGYAEWKLAREAVAAIAPDRTEDSVSWAMAFCAETVGWPAEELGNAVQSALGTLWFGLYGTAIRQGYSAEQWTARQAAEAAARKKWESDPNASPEVREAYEEIKAVRALQVKWNAIDAGQQAALNHELGERWHRGLMQSLPTATVQAGVQ